MSIETITPAQAEASPHAPIKLADQAPTYCSACHRQQPQERHVDFEAAYDGPVFDEKVAVGEGRTVTNLNVAIDELIICEPCLARGAALLGYVRDDELREQMEATEAENQNLRERLAGFGDYTERLEGAIASKPDLPKTPKQDTPPVDHHPV